jgi:hypothetical protein
MPPIKDVVEKFLSNKIIKINNVPIRVATRNDALDHSHPTPPLSRGRRLKCGSPHPKKEQVLTWTVLPLGGHKR